MVKTYDIESPYSGEILDRIKIMSEELVFSKLDIAYELFTNRDKWLSKVTRIKILEQLIHLMIPQQEKLAVIAASEGGKPYKDSIVEVQRAIQGVKVAISYLENSTGNMIPMGHTSSSENRISFTIKEPIGVVFSISAFNHPLNLIIHQVIPAIIAGAPVLIKPAKTTSLSCKNFVELLYDAGLPEEWCQLIVCENEVATKLVMDKRIQFLSFIGSSKVGWKLRSLLSDGARCVLEHGGAAPVIVEKDANLEEAIPALVKSGFYHAGQVCVSSQRIYVHEDIVETVSARLKEEVLKLKVGDPLDKDTDVGPIISKTECSRIESWVNEAKDMNTEIICGGNKINDVLFEPTIILNPDKKLNVSTKEIFGPVVCIYSYKDRLEAINQANSLPLSFQASIYSKDMDVIMDSINRLKADAVMVNEHPAFRVDWMPFGGSEESGLGTGGIPYSIDDMTKEKLVVIKSSGL